MLLITLVNLIKMMDTLAGPDGAGLDKSMGSVKHVGIRHIMDYCSMLQSIVASVINTNVNRA